MGWHEVWLALLEATDIGIEDDTEFGVLLLLTQAVKLTNTPKAGHNFNTELIYIYL